MSFWVNYDDVLGQLQEGGLLVRDLEIDTPKPKRCRVSGMDNERRGWYWLTEILLDDGGGPNERYIIGAWGIYQGDDTGKRSVKLNRDGKARKLTREQREATTQRLRENQRRLEAMREAEAEQAALLATRAWRKYVPQGKSRYLERKGVPAFGLRFHPGDIGTVAVPMTDPDGRIWGLQVIRDQVANKNRREKEYWPKRMRVQGHYHLIGGTPRRILLVAEGYATTASLHLATGLPAACAFDAGNLRHVAAVFAKRYPGIKMLVCADDDRVQKCKACKEYTLVEEPVCRHCGKEHKAKNTGLTSASAAALAIDGKWVAPVFAAERPSDVKYPTDFNDLHLLEGLHEVRAQIERVITGNGWGDPPDGRSACDCLAEGVGDAALPPRLSVEDAVQRYWGTYGLGGQTLFDEVERRLVHRNDVINLLPRHGWERMREHPDWRVARDCEIGFDPSQSEPGIRCNLYGGWPTKAKPGKCERILELLQYLCNSEANGPAVFQWLIRWLAYPIQRPGAKMHSAVVMHGPQGTGKSLVFEAIVKIYGMYGRILGQEALEDKFNADWTSKMLFILADEVLARADMFHIKNRLKGFITGQWVRVNQKLVAAYNERNHMNIVFLSNERQPIVLENDDRRHCIIWTPPKLDAEIYTQVNDEMDNGGVEALHQSLLDIDLNDFQPWTKPPMTESKKDLIELGMSSEERFMRAWSKLEIDDANGDPLPFCPCQGSHLYKVYERWCRIEGEFRPRPSNHFLNFMGKQYGWSAAKPESTWVSFQDKRVKQRKMVVPPESHVEDVARTAPPGSRQADLVRRPDETKTEWLTKGFFAFSEAMDNG